MREPPPRFRKPRGTRPPSPTRGRFACGRVHRSPASQMDAVEQERPSAGEETPWAPRLLKLGRRSTAPVAATERWRHRRGWVEVSSATWCPPPPNSTVTPCPKPRFDEPSHPADVRPVGRGSGFSTSSVVATPRPEGASWRGTGHRGEVARLVHRAGRGCLTVEVFQLFSKLDLAETGFAEDVADQLWRGRARFGTPIFAAPIAERGVVWCMAGGTGRVGGRRVSRWPGTRVLRGSSVRGKYRYRFSPLVVADTGCTRPSGGGSRCGAPPTPSPTRSRRRNALGCVDQFVQQWVGDEGAWTPAGDGDSEQPANFPPAPPWGVAPTRVSCSNPGRIG